MVMEERTLELNLMSAQDLKKVKNFGQQTCYAVAYIYAKEKKPTRVDKNGGVNPTWNSKITLTCDDALLQRGGSYITVDIFSHGSFTNKLVGTVTIPLLDVAKEGKGADPKLMAFEVRRPSGKGKGVLNLTVKVGEKRTVSAAPQITGKQHMSNGYSEDYRKQQRQGAPMGYPQTYPPKVSSYGIAAATAGSVYPPPKVTSYGTGAANAGSVYPPPKVSNYGAGAGDSAGSVYPPSSAPTSSSSSSSKVEEPVMAYPAPGYYGATFPQQQYGQNYGSQYGGGQQYYPPPQANAPYRYQQASYSKPPKRQGGGGLGLGLLGGALGGLLLGDMIGDMGGF